MPRQQTSASQTSAPQAIQSSRYSGKSSLPAWPRSYHRRQHRAGLAESSCSPPSASASTSPRSAGHGHDRATPASNTESSHSRTSSPLPEVPPTAVASSSPSLEQPSAAALPTRSTRFRAALPAASESSPLPTRVYPVLRSLR